MSPSTASPATPAPEPDLGALSQDEQAIAAARIFDRVAIAESDYYGARLADDCFCQVCGRRGVRGDLCDICRRCE